MTRLTSVTLHFNLDGDGAVHVRSDDIVGLELEGDDPNSLGTELGRILVKEARRRLCPLPIAEPLPASAGRIA